MNPPPSDKQTAPAAQRNRQAILTVLETVLPRQGKVLEIASGTGEHAIFFAAALPGLTWQPSEITADRRASIDAYRAEAGLANLAPVVPLDCTAATWPLRAADALVCVNLLHIAPWEVTEGLFRGAAQLLPKGAPLFLYGPYKQGGRHSAPSNAAFDQSLRRRNSAWGVREMESVAAEAKRRGFELAEVIPMPTNNLSLIFRK